MLRHSLYKKFGKKSFQVGGQDPLDANPYAEVVGPPAPPAPGTLVNNNPNQPYELDFANPNDQRRQDISWGPTREEPNVQRPSSPYDQDMYKIPDYNMPTEQQKFSKSDELTRGIQPDSAQPEDPGFFQKAWDYTKNNWQDMATMGLLGVRGVLNYKDDIRKNRNLSKAIQQRGVDSNPLYDYNWMYGRTTSGGTEYQPTIMAQDGMNLNNRLPMNNSRGANVEIEGGEFLILPDGTTELAKGPSHKNGGINTVLPEGTKVFSNHLKPSDLHKMKAKQKLGLVQKYAQEGGDLSMGMGLDYLDFFVKKDQKEKFKDKEQDDYNYNYPDKWKNRTFAELAKRYDLKNFQEILDNPFASAVDKQTAQLLVRRNQQILDQLFRDQQILNGNSSGEPMPTEQERQQPGMRDGGINNPGFRALPPDVQHKIMKNMEEGGYYMQDGADYQVSKKDGKYYDPTTKKYYKIPGDTQLKRDTDENLQEGDYVITKDGKIRQWTPQGYERVSTTKSSSAVDIKSGREQLQAWASESPENKAKLDRANSVIEEGLKAGTVKRGADGKLIITGDFQPPFEDRMALSVVINQTGKGFGTDKYQIGTQMGTTGYSKVDPNTGKLRGTGSFVGGFTPEVYEQRISYQKAIADGKSEQEAMEIATSTDPAQQKENRKFFLEQIGMNTEGLSEDQIMNPDFYKSRYADVTRGMENTFGSSEYRPAMGNDLMSGYEHFDAAGLQRKYGYGDIDMEDMPPPPPTTPGPPGGNEYIIKNFERADYVRNPYPISQSIPSLYAMGQDTYNYVLPEVDAPYVRPQTLNIQSQLQDADNNAMAAMRYGADPTQAYIAGLQTKENAFQTKQNYDAEGRWKADLYNADAKFRADVYNADVLDSVMNERVAGAKSAQGENRQEAINTLISNRNKWDQSENTKEFFFENYGPNLAMDKDGKVIINPNSTSGVSWGPSTGVTTSTVPAGATQTGPYTASTGWRQTSSETVSTSTPGTPAPPTNTSESPVETTQVPAGGSPQTQQPQEGDWSAWDTPTPQSPVVLTPEARQQWERNQTQFNQNPPGFPGGSTPINLPGTRPDQQWGMKLGGEMEHYLNPFKKKKSVRGFRKKK